jgi:hypothetical protein
VDQRSIVVCGLPIAAGISGNPPEKEEASGLPGPFQFGNLTRPHDRLVRLKALAADVARRAMRSGIETPDPYRPAQLSLGFTSL